MLKKLAIIAVGVMLLPGLAAGEASRRDSDVFNDASEQVLRYSRYTVFDDVSIGVQEGVVTLVGKVTMPYKAEDIARVVARVPGVTQVHNRITVLPVSFFDDELRAGIARAIYGHHLFWHYGVMTNPPIHIVVENGKVTLSGVVNSEVERAVAASLASSSSAFSVVNKLKTDEEAMAELEKIR